MSIRSPIKIKHVRVIPAYPQFLWLVKGRNNET